DKAKAEHVAQVVIERINARFTKTDVPTVEQIQDIVEEVLIKAGHDKVAKSYILYRHQHELMRAKEEMLSDFDIIDSYVTQEDWRVKENSNMAYSLQGLRNHISSNLVSNYWLMKIYPSEIGNAHKSGDIHIHDLSELSVYCVGWDLKQLLLEGFRGVRGKISCKPPGHFRSALGQVVNFFYTLQGEAAGAQAFANFDTLLAPFIRYDNLSQDEVKQCLQSFIFNTNVPTRVGFQTPFTNITLDLEVPKNMENVPVIIAGKVKEATYGEFQNEMNMFNDALADVMTEGDNDGRIFTFPIPTYNITPEFDWSEGKYEKIWEMTAKYGIPYFANFVNSDMSADDARSMCCRLRLDNRVLNKRGGGLFGSAPMTGSIGVVTINLPRIGYLANNEAEYFEKLGRVMDLAKESLVIKRKILEDYTESGLYPYSKYYLRGMKESMGQYWKNHFSTIGLIGMNESLINFMQKDITNDQGAEFAKKVMLFMRDRLADYQEETGDLYNLEATPGEGTARRLSNSDKKKYPDIIVANEKAAKEGSQVYYTNSSQLPVNYTQDLFDALNKQDPLQTLYTGGTVFHVFVGEKLPSAEAAKLLVKKITSNYAMPYVSLTPTFSICPVHGYVAGEHEYCPTCDKEDDPQKITKQGVVK
ncbi:MAG: ribonucleoside triphosphate reductase, partial [Candidatus Diapherotrites archaeon]|nr:ribonucleoside triphosphate reductase [Candidatus Diapherotrites archaeon]